MFPFLRFFFCRKLVQLKLEKGYEFGDAVLEVGAPRLKEEGSDIVLSMADEIQTKSDKSIKLICQDGVMANDFSSLPGYSDEDLTKVDGDWSKTVDCAIKASAESDLVLCQVDLKGQSENSGKKKWKNASILTRRMWDAVSEKGLLITLWCSEGSSVLMGVGFKKGQPPVALLDA